MIHHFLYIKIQRLKLKVQPAPHATGACHLKGKHDTDAPPRAPQACKSQKEEGPPYSPQAMPYPCGCQANSKLWPRSPIQGKRGGRTRLLPSLPPTTGCRPLPTPEEHLPSCTHNSQSH